MLITQLESVVSHTFSELVFVQSLVAVVVQDSEGPAQTQNASGPSLVHLVPEVIEDLLGFTIGQKTNRVVSLLIRSIVLLPARLKSTVVFNLIYSTDEFVIV